MKRNAGVIIRTLKSVKGFGDEMKLLSKIKEWQWFMIIGIILAIMAVIEKRFRIFYILAAIIIIVAVFLWIEYDMQQAKLKKKKR